MEEEIVYLSELIGRNVFDTKGRRIGTLKDAALVPLIDPVRLDRYRHVAVADQRPSG